MADLLEEERFIALQTRLDEHEQRLEEQQKTIESLLQQLDQVRQQIEGKRGSQTAPLQLQVPVRLSLPKKRSQKAKHAEAEDDDDDEAEEAGEEEEEEEKEAVSSSSSKKRRRGAEEEKKQEDEEEVESSSSAPKKKGRCGAEKKEERMGDKKLLIDSRSRESILLYKETKRTPKDFVASWHERFANEAVDCDKRSALYICVYGGKDALVAEFLLHGANANQVEPKASYTPLLACARSTTKMTSEVRENMARTLLGAGKADCNARETELGWGMLHLCAHYNHAGLLRMMLRVKNVNFSLADNEGSTALSLAVQCSHEAVVSLLLADSRCTNSYLKIEDSSGQTALVYARQSAKTESSEAILGMLREKMNGSSSSSSSSSSSNHISPPGGVSKSKIKSQQKKKPKKEKEVEEEVEDDDDVDDDEDEDEGSDFQCAWCRAVETDQEEKKYLETSIFPSHRPSTSFKPGVRPICPVCSADAQRKDRNVEEVDCPGIENSQQLKKRCTDEKRGLVMKSPKAKKSLVWRCEGCAARQQEIDSDFAKNKLTILVENGSRNQASEKPELEMKINHQVTYSKIIEAFCRVLDVEGEDRTAYGVWGKNHPTDNWVKCNGNHTVVQDSQTNSVEWTYLSLQRI